MLSEGDRVLVGNTVLVYSRLESSVVQLQKTNWNKLSAPQIKALMEAFNKLDHRGDKSVTKAACKHALMTGSTKAESFGILARLNLAFPAPKEEQEDHTMPQGLMGTYHALGQAEEGPGMHAGIDVFDRAFAKYADRDDANRIDFRGFCFTILCMQKARTERARKRQREQNRQARNKLL